jgi:exonuclease V gamma subunit
VRAFVSSWKPKYKIETLIRHYAANATSGEVATEVFAIFKSDKKNFLQPLDKYLARENLAVFIRLYLLAQKEMPLYTPEIIDDFRIAVNNDKTIDENFISSEIEKIENEMFTNDYFRLAAEQFKKDTERFSERFPEEEITMISGFLKDFQQIKNEKGKKSGKK